MKMAFSLAVFGLTNRRWASPWCERPRTIWQTGWPTDGLSRGCRHRRDKPHRVLDRGRDHGMALSNSWSTHQVVSGAIHSDRCRKGVSRNEKSLPREEVRQAFRKPNSDWEEECRCSYRRPWEEEWAVWIRSAAGGGAALQWVLLYSHPRKLPELMLHCSYAKNAILKNNSAELAANARKTWSANAKRPHSQRASGSQDDW